MPPQHVEIAETILALKRALRREKDAPSDRPISSATNRGNKLKRGANYVHAGSLPYRYSAHGYKERIEHAGYQRYILDRNPKRYNEFGDELEESESDEEADADADDENPYSDVRLEELLRPLTHPSELATHPTLSLPFLDPAIPDMVKSTEAQLRGERANLWRAKNLHRQFVGDESWMPCESVEQVDDWDLFDPLNPETPSRSSRKRKRGSQARTLGNGVEGHDHAHTRTQGNDKANGIGLRNGIVKPKTLEIPADEASEPNDIHENDSFHGDTLGENAAQEITEDVTMVDKSAPKTNGVHSRPAESGQEPDQEKTAEMEEKITEQEAEATMTSDEHKPETQIDNENVDENGETPPAPIRRITRALAAADTSNAPLSPLSPTTSAISSLSSSFLHAAPLFLLPAPLTLSHTQHQASHLPLHVAHSGLAIDEILETRRLLGMYIQKQEETIRGLEGVLGKLIKAKRMRDKIWEWCKAEGHVGEWSDGEDWIDGEAWGLRPEELRKGRDEEEVEVQEEGRKGKRRRGAAAAAVGGSGGGGGGGGHAAAATAIGGKE